MKRFWRNRAAVASLVFLIFVNFMAVFAPQVTRFSYEEQNIEARLSNPNAQHWMGTDALGRDVYSRIIYGARVSMAVGFATAFMSLIIGIVYGALAGYFGGWVDAVLMGIVDIFYIFPSLLLAMLVTLVLGQNLGGILVALGLVGWVNQARLVRGQVLQQKHFLFVEAAQALGGGHLRVIFKHIVPNLWGPIFVSLTYQIPTNIMSESFLSFLGLGLQPPLSSWGTLASDGWRAMQTYPHLILFPGGILFLSLLAFNFLGDGLKEVL